ncbi:MAG: universal stress protein [Roseibium sp.]|uniref:universal stress protein n=1 Tax=Roseibium sp. TaxID=1936156 RepID=UPI002610AA0A|nr:universal stress protein [Roseibium sp.]MCV0429748.1 universal stress protein [Roseibium sp.]
MKLRILAPVDVEEPRSWSEVLPELRQHAKGNEIELTVATVVPELGTVIAQAAQAAPFASALPADLKERALSVARDRLENLAETPEFGPIHRVVRSGTIYSEILQTAEDISADLIVLMSHVPDLGDYLLGPNAAKIVRHARCSVLVVRPR